MCRDEKDGEGMGLRDGDLQSSTKAQANSGLEERGGGLNGEGCLTGAGEFVSTGSCETAHLGEEGDQKPFGKGGS